MHDEAFDRFKLKGGAAAVGGRIVVNLGAPRRGSYWLIQRIAIECDSAPAGTSCKVYVGSEDPLNLEDFSASPNNDISDNFQDIYVPSGMDVLLVWAGVSVGARAWANANVFIVSLIPRKETIERPEDADITAR